MEDQNQQKLNNGVEDIPKIRTFQSDIADALKEQKGSIVRVAVAEQTRKQQEGEDLVVARKSNTVYVIVGIVMFVLSASVFGYYLWYEHQKNIIIDTPLQKKSFVNGDHTTIVSVTNTDEIVGRIDTIFAQSHLSVGQVEQFTITQGIDAKNQSGVLLQDLLNSYTVTTPDGFLYSLADDVYLFGIYQLTEPHRFLLLKTKVFSNTFSQTLGWEKTMAQDFKLLLATNVPDGSVVTFKDKIVKNEDVRVGTADNKEVIAYTFFGPKKELLLIAPNTEVLGSLITRFTTKLLEQ